ncbi:4-hydroxythreonine-4-phosphate dehydrogenase PdxA [Aerosakkonemataceae cyanobacterium BLCC-F154]|uniref:4-hydroxythreonine-4-phosphate dehydrogenase n=1 Tax=Floridaenema fluviatile BLCC-F154 TaxID=3153640 RepID=A0ABV4YKK4_9CYAN
MKTEQSFFTESGTILRNDDLRPCLAVTLGDPGGVGPEVILKALADPSVTESCRVTVVGSRSLLLKTYSQLREILPGECLADPDSLSMLDVEVPSVDGEITVGCGNAASGALSFAFLETAIGKTLAGEFQGIVTGPIAKSAWQAAGHDYPGQTELLAERAGVERFGMLFVARSPHTGWTLRSLLATTHIPLSQVPELLTPELMSRKLDLLVECLQKDFGIAKPRVAIAGLNPHSGEQGQLGIEEKYWLIPWLEWEKKRRSDLVLDGPIPPDTMWVKPGQAWFGNHGNSSLFTHDGYLALYHDQGLIPVKLMAFDRAINTTIGLPFVRTSPDHGTAFDIAGKGIANPTSMKAALQLAVELVKQRS